jgi:hypothetical protein
MVFYQEAFLIAGKRAFVKQRDLKRHYVSFEDFNVCKVRREAQQSGAFIERHLHGTFCVEVGCFWFSVL